MNDKKMLFFTLFYIITTYFLNKYSIFYLLLTYSHSSFFRKHFPHQLFVDLIKTIRPKNFRFFIYQPRSLRFLLKWPNKRINRNLSQIHKTRLHYRKNVILVQKSYFQTEEGGGEEEEEIDEE